ncbi:MAG: hypothetical protein QOC63_4967 [Mycobacterium sp.]|jgi:hypothetical protein|nr:hypothetical protein [Mycobacterium sp.]
MPEARQVRSAAGGGNTLWCSVDFQTRAQILDLAGGVGPQGVVRVGRHDVGFGHDCFHISSKSSVVVIVASNDSMLSMIASA